MQGDAQAVLGRGRFKPGQNSRSIKKARVAAKLDELVAEYFPNGGYGVMDGNRLKLAAAHYVDADLCRDPVIRQLRHGARNTCWPNCLRHARRLWRIMPV